LSCSAVEDRKGQAIAITIENYFDLPAIMISQSRIIELFPIGTILRIKEPYIRYGLFTGFPEVHVGVPRDIKFVQEGDDTVWNFPSPVGYSSMAFVGGWLIRHV